LAKRVSVRAAAAADSGVPASARVVVAVDSEVPANARVAVVSAAGLAETTSLTTGLPRK